MAENDEGSEYIPFSQRDEWKDVVPVPQDDGPNPICRIAYSPQFQETMDYFRAIMHKNERSQRALKLTMEVINLNAANYTAWYYRRLLLDDLHCDLEPELEEVTKLGNENPKNYQIWYHRRILLEKLSKQVNEMAMKKLCTRELEFCANQIEEDNKNYHAWAHRQWIIETYNMWEGELEYVTSLLNSDMRNNSAWNQRYFVVTRNRRKELSKEERDQEIQFAVSYIKKAPNNQSPWAYLKGLFFNVPYSSNPDLKQLCLQLNSQYVTCPHGVALLVDILEQEGKASVPQALEYCDKLENHLDTIHQKYWSYRKQKLQEQSS